MWWMGRLKMLSSLMWPQAPPILCSPSLLGENTEHSIEWYWFSQSLRGLVAACRHAFEFSLRKVQKCNDQNWKLNNRSDFGWTPLFIPTVRHSGSIVCQHIETRDSRQKTTPYWLERHEYPVSSNEIHDYWNIHGLLVGKALWFGVVCVVTAPLVWGQWSTSPLWQFHTISNTHIY